MVLHRFFDVSLHHVDIMGQGAKVLIRELHRANFNVVGEIKLSPPLVEISFLSIMLCALAAPTRQEVRNAENLSGPFNSVTSRRQPLQNDSGRTPHPADRTNHPAAGKG